MTGHNPTGQDLSGRTALVTGSTAGSGRRPRPLSPSGEPT